MSDPDEAFPADILAVAERYAGFWFGDDRALHRTNLAKDIGRAMKIERERCAKIAENRDPFFPDNGDHIAKMIREG